MMMPEAGNMPGSADTGLRACVLSFDDLGSALARPETLAAIRQALDCCGVVRILALTVEAPAVSRIAATLGPSREGRTACSLEGHDAIQVLITPARAGVDEARIRDSAHILHADYSHAELPPTYVMLHPRTPTPPLATCWVDMRRVLADLPLALRRRITSLGAVHAKVPDQVTARVHRDLAEVPAALRDQGPIHPLVCRHPRTGIPFLFLPVRRDSKIPGLPDAPARALLTELWDAVAASPHRLSMPIAQGELVVWDNLAMTHDKPAYPAGEAREVWFLTLGGALLQPARFDHGA